MKRKDDEEIEKRKKKLRKEKKKEKKKKEETGYEADAEPPKTRKRKLSVVGFDLEEDLGPQTPNAPIFTEILDAPIDTPLPEDDEKWAETDIEVGGITVISNPVPDPITQELEEPGLLVHSDIEVPRELVPVYRLDKDFESVFSEEEKSTVDPNYITINDEEFLWIDEPIDFNSGIPPAPINADWEASDQPIEDQNEFFKLDIEITKVVTIKEKSHYELEFFARLPKDWTSNMPHYHSISYEYGWTRFFLKAKLQVVSYKYSKTQMLKISFTDSTLSTHPMNVISIFLLAKNMIGDLRLKIIEGDVSHRKFMGDHYKLYMYKLDFETGSLRHGMTFKIVGPKMFINQTVESYHHFFVKQVRKYLNNVKNNPVAGSDMAIDLVDGSVNNTHLVQGIRLISISIIGIREMETPSVGCLGENGKVNRNYMSSFRKMIKSPDTNNDCFMFSIFQDVDAREKIKKIIENEFKNEVVDFLVSYRSIFNIDHNDPLSKEEMILVASKLKIRFEIWAMGEVSFYKYFTNEHLWDEKMKKDKIIVMIATGQKEPYHVNYVGETKNGYIFKNYVKCHNCGKLAKRGSVHLEKCVTCVCGIYYLKGGNHTSCCKQVNILKDKKNKKDGKYIKIYEKAKESIKENIWFADFEAFPDKDNCGNHTVYAASLINIKNRELVFYGRNALEDFMNFLYDKKNKVSGILYFYNGSGYDIHLMIQWIIINKPEMIQKYSKSILKKGNRFISLKLKGTPALEIRDLYLFTLCSLKNACKAFKIEEDKSKKGFDFSSVTSWECVDKKEIETLSKHYVLQDSIALREVYKSFSLSIWNNFKMNICSFYTLSHLADAIWTTLLPCKVIPIKPKYEEDTWMRRGYYGGRVAPQNAHWEVKKIEEILKNPCKAYYDDIKKKGKYLVYVDVVSLYPSVMKGIRYPFGDKIKKTKCKFTEDLLQINKLRNTQYTKYRRIMKKLKYRTIVEVDIEAPKNLLTPYLFKKDDKGNSKVDLQDGIKQVYYGPDLYEAILLGYKIKKIYSLIYWKMSQTDFIFDKYIDIMFDGKKKAGIEKDAVSYMIYKILMNALSGKHAQKLIKEYYQIVAPNTVENDEKLEYMDDICPLYDKLNELIGFSGNVKIEDVTISHCCYLSGFILAHSRKKMSKALRTMKTGKNKGAYNSIEHNFFYQDTDSYIMKKESFDLMDKRLIGNELGQFKDEYLDDGEGLIIEYVCLAKKTYSYLLIKNDGKIYCKVRCKGIPHRGDLFEYLEASDLTARFDALYKELEKINHPPIDLQVYYYGNDKNKKAYLTTQDFKNILFKKEGFEDYKCYYGSLTKNMTKYTNTNSCYGVITLFNNRTISKNLYWDKGERIFYKNTFNSVPVDSSYNN